jgi:hypothetical protein
LAKIIVKYAIGKGIETICIQSLNLIIPIIPILAQGGIDFLMEVAPVIESVYEASNNVDVEDL